MSSHCYEFLLLLVLTLSHISAAEKNIDLSLQDTKSIKGYINDNLSKILPIEPLIGFDNKTSYHIENSCFYTYYKQQDKTTITTRNTSKKKKKKKKKKNDKKIDAIFDKQIHANNQSIDQNNTIGINNNVPDENESIKEDIRHHHFALAKRKIKRIKDDESRNELNKYFMIEYNNSIQGKINKIFEKNTFFNQNCQGRTKSIIDIFSTPRLSQYDENSAIDFDKNIREALKFSPLKVMLECLKTKKLSQLSDVLKKLVNKDCCYINLYNHFSNIIVKKQIIALIQGASILIKGKEDEIEIIINQINLMKRLGNPISDTEKKLENAKESLKPLYLKYNDYCEQLISLEKNLI